MVGNLYMWASGIRYQVSTAHSLLIHCLFAACSGSRTAYSLLIRGHLLILHFFFNSLFVLFIHCLLTAYSLLIRSHLMLIQCVIGATYWPGTDKRRNIGGMTGGFLTTLSKKIGHGTTLGRPFQGFRVPTKIL